MLIDSHVHLDWFPEEALGKILERARAAGVDTILTVGSDLASSARAVEIAALYPGGSSPGSAGVSPVPGRPRSTGGRQDAGAPRPRLTADG